MRPPSSRLYAASAAAFMLSFVLAPALAHAAKNHCRSIELSGAAGPSSADVVELQVTDYLGNILDRSCAVTVQNNECADDLAQRLVATWGNGAQGGSQDGCGVDQGTNLTCGKNLDLTPVSGSDTDVFKIFCEHKYKAGKVSGGQAALDLLEMLNQCPQAPPDGEKAESGEFKKFPTIEVCCYEADPLIIPSFDYLDPSHCSGSKLGKTLITPQRIEVSLFDRINRPNIMGDGIYFEPKLPSNELDVPVGVSSRLISLDPIGFTQRPSPKNVGCRSDIAAAAAGLQRTASSVLRRCHVMQLDGTIPLSVDCNVISEADLKLAVPVAETALTQAAAADCEGPDVLSEGPRVSPAVYGLRTCPAPCSSIVIGTCSAGLVGNGCSSDRECDTAIGAADGKCGDWDAATDCIACLQTSAATTSVSSLLGSVPRPLASAEDIRCVEGTAKILGTLVGVFSKEMLSCQKRADAAKAALAPGKTCKNADLKGLRAAAEARTQDLLSKSCLGSDVSTLLMCSPVATTPAELADCIIDSAKDMIDALTAGVFPENAKPPGACPSSVDFTMVAGTSGSCTNNSQCITGQCIGGKCVTNTSIDIGWTGQLHNQDIGDKVEMDLALTCAAAEAPCGTCAITGVEPTSGNCRCANDPTARCDEPFAADIDDCGGAQCRCFFQPPMPLFGASNPVCMMVEHASEVTGTIDVDAGQVSASADLSWQLYLGISVDSPCPKCVGDDAANDGIAGGTCSGGARNGLMCDRQATDPTFGPVSIECPPSGLSLISGPGLTIDLDLSTGPSSLTATLPCDPPLGAFMCACAQCSGDPTIACDSTADCTVAGAGTCTTSSGTNRQPNSCGDLTCEPSLLSPDEGECTGDLETYCDGYVRASGDGLIQCLGQGDCDAVDPSCPGGDCGTCSLSRPPRCFLPTINGGGVAHPTSPTLAGTFCMAPTTSPAANSAIGLTGPGRMKIQGVPTYVCSTSPVDVYTPGEGGCPP